MSACPNVGTEYIPEQEIPVGSTEAQSCSSQRIPGHKHNCPNEVIVIPAHNKAVPKAGFTVRVVGTVQPKKFKVHCKIYVEPEAEGKQKQGSIRAVCERIGNGENNGPPINDYNESLCQPAPAPPAPPPPGNQPHNQ